MASPQVTDRALRYRAQKNVTGPRRCVICGSRSDLGVMHLDGDESHGQKSNLAYGCRSCNGKLSAAFKRAGIGRPTNQYNPAGGGIPTLKQYAWAVGNHTRGAHDEGGAVIHATPPHVRVEYARAMAGKSQRTKKERFDDRWNPAVIKVEKLPDWKESVNYPAGTVFETANGQMYRVMPKGRGFKRITKVRGGLKSGETLNPWPFSRPDARKTTPATGGVAYHTAKMGKRTAAKSKKAAGSGVRAVPSDSEIEAGFKRGLSLREILGNPSNESVQDKSWREWAENFNRVTRDPEGATEKDLRRALGYLDKARGSFIRRAHEKGLKPDGNVLAGYDNEYEYLKSLMLKRERGGRRNAGWEFGGDDIPLTARQRNEDALADIERKMGLGRQGTKAWWALYKRKQKLVKALTRDNPAAASAAAFEEFHGFEPAEVITVRKKVFHHEHLSAAGKLTHLDVWGLDKQGHHITGFKAAILAFNEDKNQLFVEGGDQFVNLEDFGIDPPHELETLGRLTDIGYQTNKTHLGDEGGNAVYVHKFRSINKAGKHVVVKIARYPDLIYDVRNEQLLFSGGSYEILREGINK